MIIDPRPLTRDCLTIAIEQATAVEHVIAVANADEAVIQAAGAGRLDAALINLAADPFSSGDLLRITERLREIPSLGAIVLLTSMADVEHVRIAMNHGVQGMVISDTSLDLTVSVIRLVSMGWMIYPAYDAFPVRPLQRWPAGTDAILDPCLTPRQREVLGCLKQGMTNNQIAEALSLSERTVKAHIQELMRRLGAQNRTQIVAITAERWDEADAS